MRCSAEEGIVSRPGASGPRHFAHMLHLHSSDAAPVCCTAQLTRSFPWLLLSQRSVRLLPDMNDMMITAAVVVAPCRLDKSIERSPHACHNALSESCTALTSQPEARALDDAIAGICSSCTCSGQSCEEKGVEPSER